ncbi:hypothetical protein Taro_026720 [Colocasia esculenta]|uniref:Endoplasmic reticulum transmembrane protein n=1 Tax=Colocasia esculenta TaxID=4460 RepID=A0A843VC40_COLES|nr:hypothetical protein [Colocasia esculenta]
MRLARSAMMVRGSRGGDAIVDVAHNVQGDLDVRRGYLLFLALVIDRMHHYIRELRVLRKGMEAVTKQNRMAEEGKDRASKELKAREQEIIQLNAKIAKLELESEARVKEVKTAQANALALSKQTEGFLLEYDRLLEENQNLRAQLKSIDCQLSRSDSKKNT